MTSNFAIGNAVAAPIAPASNVPLFGDFAGMFNPPAINGSTPVYGERQLIAAGLGRRPSAGAVIKVWHKRLKEAVAPNAATPAPAGKAPFIPVSDASKGTPASALFNNKNARTWKVQGVPELTGPIDNKVRSALDDALTPQRMRAFENLSEHQKTTALTLLYAGLEAMKLPAGSAGRIDPKDMGVVVETALQYGRQTPTALGRSANPGNGATTSQGVPRATPDQVPTSKRVPHATPDQVPTSKRVPHATPESIPTSKPVASATRSSSSDPRSEFTPTPLWSDQRISDKVDALAEKLKITAPQTIALMKDLLTNPAVALEQRVNHHRYGATQLRQALPLQGRTDLRTALARAVGMPFSALIARIRTQGDATLGQRVMDSINPTQREVIAERLLTQAPGRAGSIAEVALYRTLDSILLSGDPWISYKELAQLYPGIGAPTFNVAISSLSKLFGGSRASSEPTSSDKNLTDQGRINMLHNMGYSHVQILRMSDVGNELHWRLDPALDTYSNNEKAVRRDRGLPASREEAAQQMLSVRYGKRDDPLSHRDLIVLGVLSDKPWLTNKEMSAHLSAFNPEVSHMTGESALMHLFQATDRILPQPFARGSANRLQDPAYLAATRIKTLQVFGLSARERHTGKRQSIPTDFDIQQSPSPEATKTRSTVPQQPSTPGVRDQVHWRELLPLLQPSRRI